MATFGQSVVPSNHDWGGRTDYETSPTPGSDTCWFPDAAKDGVQPITTVTGGGFTFASGSSYKDDIGTTIGVVLYYRSHNRAPCGFQVQQALWMECDPADHSKDANYLTYTDSVGIGTTDVVATRGGGRTETFWIAPAVKAATQAVNQLLLKKRD
jgi:hypothetical protein